MAWPGLLAWTIAAAIALPLAVGVVTGAGLLALQALAAITGLGLWLAYLVEDGSRTLAWIALGVAGLGLLSLLAALVRDDGDTAPAVSVSRWVATGLQTGVFVATGIVCLLAGLGVQSSL